MLDHPRCPSPPPRSVDRRMSHPPHTSDRSLDGRIGLLLRPADREGGLALEAVGIRAVVVREDRAPDADEDQVRDAAHDHARDGREHASKSARHGGGSPEDRRSGEGGTPRSAASGEPRRDRHPSAMPPAHRPLRAIPGTLRPVKARTILLLTGVAALLVVLVPLVAMRLGSELQWSRFDFAVAVTAVVALGVCAAAIAQRAPSRIHLAAMGVALGASLVLLWLTGAVGTLASERHPANMLYPASLLLAVGGAIGSRFEPRGMSRAIFATAVAIAVVPLVASFRWELPPMLALLKAFILSGVFAALFAASGVLFRRASRAGENSGGRRGAG